MHRPSIQNIRVSPFAKVIDDDANTIMDTVFDDAISAHLSWLVRFESVLMGISREQFDPLKIGDHRICKLGQWLCANPTLFNNADQLEQIVNLHRAFHEKAATLASLFGSQAPREIVQPHWDTLGYVSGLLVEALNREIELPR